MTEENKKEDVKNYIVSLEPEYNERWEKIAKKNYSDKSKMLRRWIDEHEVE